MKEPVEVELIEVLTPKGEIIPGVSLKRDAFVPAGKTAEPWYPAKVLILLTLKDSFRTIFPDEYRAPGVECKIVEDIGARHVLALYDNPPPTFDAPVAEEPAAETEAAEESPTQHESDETVPPPSTHSPFPQA